MDREDGEMSDDEPMAIDDDKKTITVPDTELTVFYKAEKEGIIAQTLGKVDAAKLDERAKRFGLNLSGNRVVTQKQIDELYVNFGIESGNERHFRFDTLHLSGVDGLTTKEIFEYLEDYKPVSLEWIDGISCNVVCQDHISVALALLVHSREISNVEVKEMISQKSSYHWREGMPHEKKDFILMRFATKSDKKDTSTKVKPDSSREPKNYDQSMDPIGKNPWGDLCQSWGVYDHQEILSRKLPADDEDEFEKPSKPVQIKNSNLAKRLGKRACKSEDSDSDSSDTEWTKRQKVPRMRMHADDEETKSKKKKRPISPECVVKQESFAPLSIEVANTDSYYSQKEITILSEKFKKHEKRNSSKAKDGVHSRLGARVADADEGWSSDGSSGSDHNVMSRVQKINKNSNSNVWMRLDNKSEDTNQNDLRQMLKSKKSIQPNRKNPSSDLRERIKSKEGISLRVEIDNEYHHNRSD